MSKMAYLDIKKKINDERRLFEKIRTGRHQWVKLGSLYSNRTRRGGESPAWGGVLSKYIFWGGVLSNIYFCQHLSDKQANGEVEKNQSPFFNSDGVFRT